ncbi:hypothetical protein [Proteus mirabilis]|uniref:hypothetical protein n=1 Tax=Proteus mirabilis TaxID=584 RepID=UPI0034D651E4
MLNVKMVWKAFPLGNVNGTPVVQKFATNIRTIKSIFESNVFVDEIMFNYLNPNSDGISITPLFIYVPENVSDEEIFSVVESTICKGIELPWVYTMWFSAFADDDENSDYLDGIESSDLDSKEFFLYQFSVNKETKKIVPSSAKEVKYTRECVDDIKQNHDDNFEVYLVKTLLFLNIDDAYQRLENALNSKGVSGDCEIFCVDGKVAPL